MNPRFRTTAFILYSVGLVLLMSSAIRSLAEFSVGPGRTAASQIVLVPFVSAALIYLKRRTVFDRVDYAPLPGGVTLALGTLLLLAANWSGTALQTADQLSLQAASLVVLWLGGFLFFYGTAAFRAGLFPLLFLVFCIPIPAVLLDPTIAFLQRGTAEIVFVLFQLSGTPVFREGFVFALPDLVIEVAPECSGIRSGIGMFMTSLLGGHVLLGSWWSRTALVVAAVPLAILKNAIRIDTLSLLSVHIDPSIIDGRLHHEGGPIFFMLGLLFLYPVLHFLMRRERVWSPGQPAEDSL